MLSRIRKWVDEKQLRPSLDDIKNNEVKKLAKRLKGKSIKETLTNIVEWQERNLTYWWERFLLDVPKLPLLTLPLLLFVVLSLPFLIISFFINKTLFLVTLFITVGLIIAFFFSGTIGKIYYLFIGASIVCFSFIILTKLNALNNYLAGMLFYGISLSILGFMVYYLYFRYQTVEKKSFFEIFKDTFKFSLDVEKILKYRLAICRDYAKLTAAILLNIYPKNKIYFITFNFPKHSATAIEYKNKIYVLDQQLPVMTLEKWLILWKEELNKKKLKANVLEIVFDGKKIKTKKIDCKKSDRTKIPKVDIKGLTNTLLNNLRVKPTIRKTNADLEIPLKNLAISYEKDEIIVFSIIKTIENKLENEFCDLSKISRIELRQNKKDIILRIWIN